MRGIQTSRKDLCYKSFCRSFLAWPVITKVVKIPSVYGIGRRVAHVYESLLIEPRIRRIRLTPSQTLYSRPTSELSYFYLDVLCCPFHSGFARKILHSFLTCLMRATCPTNVFHANKQHHINPTISATHPSGRGAHGSCGHQRHTCSSHKFGAPEKCNP